jgi:hypothetical protein
MTPTRARLALVVCATAWAATCASGARVEPPPPDTQRVLDAIATNRPTLTAANWDAARRMNTDGDREYRAHNYRNAWMAYANSYPNAPTAHAYIMTGDTHWRMTTDLAGPLAGSTDPCPLRNAHFAHDLALDLAQHYAVGFALAAQENDRAVLESAMYSRARASADCLERLAKEYESKAASDCVDLSRLRSCLGQPLLDPR